MRDVAWRFFRGETFADVAELERRVHEYNAETGKEWEPDPVVLPAPRVRITYFGVESPEDEEYGEFSVDLASDDGEALAAGELLFKPVNAVAPHLEGVGHCYFEAPPSPAPSGNRSPCLRDAPGQLTVSAREGPSPGARTKVPGNACAC
ncbi:MAG TPA: hypothetical protein VHG08_27595 [Longimicrobium sp.]|nr:hypothetical protein [Longimicrobium sp.]